MKYFMQIFCKIIFISYICCMEYIKYMSDYQARKEREAQLVEKYSQKPVSANRPLRLLDMEKVSGYHREAKEAIIGILIAGIILAIAIFIL